MSNHTRKQLVREDQQTVTVGAKSWDALWAASAPPDRPSGATLESDGWLAVDAIAHRWALARQTAAKKLGRLVEAGKFEQTTGRRPTGTLAFYYRPKPPGVTRLVR
jgi:hypothetical protein